MRFLKLSRGSHKAGSGQGCAMEAVSALNGELWSDRPACVCPVIAAYVRTFNDFLPDERRAKYLTPDLLIRLIGTRGDTASMVARAKVAAESAVAVAAKYAKSDVVVAARYARSDAEDAAEFAEFATESMAVYDAQSTARSAADYGARAAKFAAEASAEAADKIYRDCVNTIEKMIVAGAHHPAEPKYSLEEIAPLFGGFQE